MPDDVDDAIRALYAGEPGDFVKVRAALAKEHKERSAELKALRKPERRAWALDRAAADDPKALDQLVKAAAAVADAQESGGDIRAATTALRDAVKALASKAPDPGAATSDLVAVVAEPEALDALRAGRLVAVPEGGGFGPLPTGPAPAREDDAAARRKAEQEERKRLDAERKALEQARKEAEGEVAAAEADLTKAQRRLDEARAALDELD